MLRKKNRQVGEIQGVGRIEKSTCRAEQSGAASRDCRDLLSAIKTGPKTR